MAEVRRMAGTSFPDSRYRSETRCGRNSAEDRAPIEARDAVTFSFVKSEPLILARFGKRCRSSEQEADPRVESLMGQEESRYTFEVRCRAGPVRAGPALHVWPQ